MPSSKCHRSVTLVARDTSRTSIGSGKCHRSVTLAARDTSRTAELKNEGIAKLKNEGIAWEGAHF